MALTKLSDTLQLTNKIETITAMDFRKSPGEVLTQVTMGKTFIITRAGKPMAVLSRLPGTQLTIEVDRKGKIGYAL